MRRCTSRHLGVETSELSFRHLRTELPRDPRDPPPGAAVRRSDPRDHRVALPYVRSSGTRASSPASTTPREIQQQLAPCGSATPIRRSSTGRRSPAAACAFRSSSSVPASTSGTFASAAGSSSSRASSTSTDPRSPASVRSRGAPSSPRASRKVVEHRAARHGAAVCTTSRPARATSSPNGVVSHNCFARPTHEYLDFDAGRDFEKEIVVKVNVPEVLRKELARPSWKREHVAMGTNTDPYQWVEGRYKLMRGIWAALRDARTRARSSRSRRCCCATSTSCSNGRAGRDQRVPLGADARREGLAGDRAAHAAPEGAARGGREAQRGRHPDGHPDRAADARDQRRARAGRADHRARDRGRRGVDRRADAVPARLDARRVLRLAALVPARPRAALRAPLRARQPASDARAARDRARGGRCRAVRRRRTRDGRTAAGRRARAPRAAAREAVRQERCSERDVGMRGSR